MFPALLSQASPPGTRARLSILIFHRVLDAPDPLFPDLPDADEFERMMTWIRHWFQVLPLREAADRLATGGLPARALVITFDDGYADNATIAAPVLQRLGLPATFFVCPGFLDGGRMWNDEVIEAIRACPDEIIDLERIGVGSYAIGTVKQRRAAIDRILDAIKHRAYEERARCVEAIVDAAGVRPDTELMMTRAQVKTLHEAGMSIGGHTVTHPILTRLPPQTAFREIAQGKHQLEQIVGGQIDVFAYPNGLPGRDYAAEHVAMVRRCGFACAVSTAWGAARSGADLFQLPRFTPWNRTRWRFGLQLLQNLFREQFAVV